MPTPCARALGVAAVVLGAALCGADEAAAKARAEPMAAFAPKRADLGREAASPDVRRIAHWALDARDHEGLPFAIVDKSAARVYVFSREGRLLGAAPILLGRAIGDDFAPGVEDMDMYDTSPWQRVTPAGRFRAESYRKPDGQWILWVDYDSAIALHKVPIDAPAEQRQSRIDAPDPAQRRITYGCINVPVAFYERVIHPTFARSRGIVYVLPEQRPLESVFAWYEVAAPRDAYDRALLIRSGAAGALATNDEPRAPRPAERRASAMKLLPTRRANGALEEAEGLNP